MIFGGIGLAKNVLTIPNRGIASFKPVCRRVAVASFRQRDHVMTKQESEAVDGFSDPSPK